MSILDEYVAEAAKLYDVTADELMGTSRFRQVVNARREVMVRLRRDGWSACRIGRAFNRHHTSVLHLTSCEVFSPPVRDNRPRPPRISAKATPEQLAEIDQRRYERTHRENAIEGSRALLERQYRYGQFPVRLLVDGS